MKKSKITFLFFLCLACAGEAIAGTRQSARVTEAVSGDSVRLSGGKILKYAGIQSPPRQSKTPLVREYGEAAYQFNQALVAGKPIQIEWDAQIRDGQGVLLGYVFLEDGTFVNQEILRAGHAKAVATPPNLRYADSFRKLDLSARRGKAGLWKEEPENPFIRSEYIGDVNTKIYYFPTSPELERIPEAHLIKFKSRVDAKAAGYRACFDCNEADQTLI